jgi:hypothetical protein
VGGGTRHARPADHAVLLTGHADSITGRYAGAMIALITDSKVILAITMGIPILLGLIALGAVLTRPKR